MLFGKTLLLLCLTLVVQPEHVKRVIDGDTFILFHVGVPAEERVRVLGVDAVELRTPKGIEAKEFTKTWIANGPFSMVACKRDSFGRLLGAVSRDQDDLGKALIDKGLGVPYLP